MCTARSHPGESPASYVIQGLLEFLLSNHPIATILREHFVFKIIPMLNPDGVFLGNNRCNLVGHDLNRYWNNPSQFTTPTLFAVTNLLKELDNSDYYQIDFVIDIHGHSTLNGSFIYGNTYEDVYRYERHLVFPKLLSTNADDYVQEHMMFNADDRKSGSSRRFCCERLSDTINSYTLEVSMCGYYLKGTRIMAQYTEDGYMRLGRNVIRTFLIYYRFTNVLPIPPVTELHTRRGRPKTHRPRTRSRHRDTLARPKTTRSYAPISYTDLAIGYDSTSSNDVSPVRQSYHGYGFGKRSTGNAFLNQDQFSLTAIQASKFNNLDFSSEYKTTTKSTKSKVTIDSRAKTAEILNIPPKPYLSIIDFNQLTRGGLDEATGKIKGKSGHQTKKQI